MASRRADGSPADARLDTNLAGLNDKGFPAPFPPGRQPWSCRRRFGV